MSGDGKRYDEKPEETRSEAELGSAEGWEALVEEEESGGRLAPNPELEAALREATESADRRSSGKAEAGSGNPGSGQKAAKDDEELVLANPIEGPPREEALRLQTELAESNDRLLRLQADFENFRKRANREHQEAMQFGAQNLVKDLLSVVDNLERAIDHARRSEAGDLQGVLQGVELVQRELLGVLEKHHVKPVDALGQPFNPAFHEAMAQVTDDAAEPNTVVEVLQKGYQLRDRLLRPAKVVVTRAADGPGDGGQGEATG